MTKEETISNLKANQKSQEELIETANKAVDAAETDYQSMLDGWYNQALKEKEEREKANQAEAKADNRRQMWTGIADASAALVNLIGTTKGATSQNWQSPQTALGQEIERRRLEREKKTETITNQLKALDDQRAKLKYNFATNKANRDYKFGEVQSQNAATLAKLQNDANTRLNQRINSAATTLYKERLRNAHNNGDTPTEAERNQWLAESVAEATKLYGGSAQEESLFKGL